MGKRKAHKKKETAAQKKAKFYKHLKEYLFFVIIAYFIDAFLHINLDSIILWWGFGMVIYYFNTFGKEHLKPATAEQQRRCQANDELELEEYVELKQPQKTWRERDLV